MLMSEKSLSKWWRRLALVAGSVLALGVVQNGEGAPRGQKIKIEVKLVVPTERVTQAVQTLGLATNSFTREEVVYFDTADGALLANSLILRARWRPGGTADSTTKLRGDADPAELTELEEQIKPEQDWTDETRPAISRSANNTTLPHGLVQQVIHGAADAAPLFNAVQRGLVATHLKDFPWKNLRRYGPCAAEVWKENIGLRGFAEPVTVERWHLQKGATNLDLLEISAKAKMQNEAAARDWVKTFYQAAADAGLSRPPSQSKTRIVMDFFKPGI